MINCWHVLVSPQLDATAWYVRVMIFGLPKHPVPVFVVSLTHDTTTPPPHKLLAVTRFVFGAGIGDDGHESRMFVGHTINGGNVFVLPPVRVCPSFTEPEVNPRGELHEKLV
jgi:hypothetical protein